MNLFENTSTITTNSPISETWDRYSDDLGSDIFYDNQDSIQKIENEFYYDTEVIVIGNGPAGIALSAFLSGIQPYYNGSAEHHNKLLHQKLLDGKNEVNLLYQDIDWFETEFQNLIKPGTTPEASFYDVLNNSPNDDESCLKVKINQNAYTPHMVIGLGEIGGSWNTYDDEMVSLSFGNGMDLPGYSLKDYLNCSHTNVRLPARVVRDYFQNYVKKMGLDKNFINNTKVIGMEKLCDTASKTEFWNITCLKDDTLIPYNLTCKKVVLAIGKNVIQKLDLNGVYNENKIIYELRDLKGKIEYLRKGCQRNANNFFTSNGLFHYFLCSKKDSFNKSIKVIVVGDGYGAADVISYCLSMGIYIIHIIKRDKLQMKNHKLSSISDSIYPEYSSIYRLMMGRINNPYYVRYLRSSISEIYDDEVVIETGQGKINENYTFIVPCIGKKVDDTLKLQNFNISQTYRNRFDPTIFGIGSLIGDHYVRECVGGALAVARMIINKNSLSYREY